MNKPVCSVGYPRIPPDGSRDPSRSHNAGICEVPRPWSVLQFDKTHQMKRSVLQQREPARGRSKNSRFRLQIRIYLTTLNCYRSSQSPVMSGSGVQGPGSRTKRERCPSVHRGCRTLVGRSLAARSCWSVKRYGQGDERGAQGEGVLGGIGILPAMRA